jgi:hypothetical protein
MRSSIATVGTPSPAKAVSQLPKVRFEVFEPFFSAIRGSLAAENTDPRK